MGTRKAFANASKIIANNPSDAFRFGLFFRLAADDGSVIGTLDTAEEAQLPQGSPFVTKYVASNDGGFTTLMTLPHQGNLQELAPVAEQISTEFANSNLTFDQDGHIAAFYAAPPTDLTLNTRPVLDAFLTVGDNTLFLSGMMELNGQPLQIVDYQCTSYMGALRLHVLTANNEVFQLGRIEQAAKADDWKLLSLTRTMTDVNAFVTRPGTVQRDHILYATTQGIVDQSGRILGGTGGKNIAWMIFDHARQLLIWGVAKQVYTGVVANSDITDVKLQINNLSTALRTAGASPSLYKDLPVSQLLAGPATGNKLLAIDWKAEETPDGIVMLPKRIEVPLPSIAA